MGKDKPAANKPAGDSAGKTPSERGAVRVILADTQAIFRVGIRKIFALEDDIRVVAQAETLGQLLLAAGKYPADVILVESSISPTPAEAVSEVMRRAPGSKIIVLSYASDEDDVMEFVRRGVRGIIPRSVGPDLLVRCVRKVFEGETWLDNRGINWVIEAYRAQADQLMMTRPKGRLSDKEQLIISCVTQGMKNKEIAHEVGTTEQVVKNYLRKIYDKLGVSDRLELALYCVHHRLLSEQRASAPAEAANTEEQPATAGARSSSATVGRS
jgi:DNA-binding NarL/FixJ family response regulator